MIHTIAALILSVGGARITALCLTKLDKDGQMDKDNVMVLMTGWTAFILGMAHFLVGGCR